MSLRQRTHAVSLNQALHRIPGTRGERSATLFRHGSLEVKLAAPSARALHGPPRQDQLCVIARGHAYLCHEGHRDWCCPGDVLFVAAGTEHSFESFSDDFSVWVMNYGPQGGEAKRSQRRRTQTVDSGRMPPLGAPARASPD